MQLGFILTSRDKYSKESMKGKDCLGNRLGSMRWRSLQHPQHWVEFELLSLGSLDSLCPLGSVPLEILYLQVNADLVFSREQLVSLSIEPPL